MTPTGIVPGWSSQPAGRPVRPAGFALFVASALLAALPVQPAAASVSAESASVAATAGPQWITSDQRAATHFIALLQSADLDGLDPNRFKIKQLLRANRQMSNLILPVSPKAHC